MQSNTFQCKYLICNSSLGSVEEVVSSISNQNVACQSHPHCTAALQLHLNGSLEFILQTFLSLYDMFLISFQRNETFGDNRSS